LVYAGKLQKIEEKINKKDKKEIESEISFRNEKEIAQSKKQDEFMQGFLETFFNIALLPLKAIVSISYDGAPEGNLYQPYPFADSSKTKKAIDGKISLGYQFQNDKIRG